MKWDGTKLKELVKTKGFSITRIAEELDVSRQAFTSWTNDHVPKGSHLVRLSRVLDVDPGYFFVDDPVASVTVPLHRKRGVAKITPVTEREATELAKEYEAFFRSSPVHRIVPVTRIRQRGETDAVALADDLRRLAKVESDKPITYKQTFELLEILKIVVVFREFPETVKTYAFYSRICGHRVVFVNTGTNELDLIFPLLHEAIHAIRDELEMTEYDAGEEFFCDAVAGHIQFPKPYLEIVHGALEGRRPSHQVNILKEFASRHGHSLFGLGKQLKKDYPAFSLEVAPADNNLRKGFPTIGEMLFRDEDPRCFIETLRRWTPLFFDFVAGHLGSFPARKVGQWLGLESGLDAVEVISEWKKGAVCA